MSLFLVNIFTLTWVIIDNTVVATLEKRREVTHIVYFLKPLESRLLTLASGLWQHFQPKLPSAAYEIRGLLMFAMTLLILSFRTPLELASPEKRIYVGDLVPHRS